MKAHLKYLSYVLRHKWFVFVECCKFGIPLAGIIHDWQKFTPIEWKPYVLYFYGPYTKENRPQWLKDAFDAAWLHHIHHGPHHAQYWVLREDSGKVVCLEMPYRYLVEMLADWKGAGMAQGKPDIAAWYKENGHKYPMHPNTRKHVESYLGVDHESILPRL